MAFKIGKNKMADITEFNPDDIDMIKKLLISIYLSLQSKHTYKIQGISRYTIRRLQVDYENIIEILNKQFKYNFNVSDEIKPKSDLRMWIKAHWKVIEKIFNFRAVKFVVGNENLFIKGYDIYWGYWKEYRKTFETTGTYTLPFKPDPKFEIV